MRREEKGGGGERREKGSRRERKKRLTQSANHISLFMHTILLRQKMPRKDTAGRPQRAI